jgi:hypothetical protein
VEAERRQVTVLFTDMVGFTTFSERSGEEASAKGEQGASGPAAEPVKPHGAVCPLLIRQRPHLCSAVNDVKGHERSSRRPPPNVARIAPTGAALHHRLRRITAATFH